MPRKKYSKRQTRGNKKRKKKVKKKTHNKSHHKQSKNMNSVQKQPKHNDKIESNFNTTKHTTPNTVRHLIVSQDDSIQFAEYIITENNHESKYIIVSKILNSSVIKNGFLMKGDILTTINKRSVLSQPLDDLIISAFNHDKSATFSFEGNVYYPHSDKQLRKQFDTLFANHNISMKIINQSLEQLISISPQQVTKKQQLIKYFNKLSKALEPPKPSMFGIYDERSYMEKAEAVFTYTFNINCRNYTKRPKGKRYRQHNAKQIYVANNTQTLKKISNWPTHANHDSQVNPLNGENFTINFDFNIPYATSERYNARRHGEQSKSDTFKVADCEFYFIFNKGSFYDNHNQYGYIAIGMNMCTLPEIRNKKLCCVTFKLKISTDEIIKISDKEIQNGIMIDAGDTYKMRRLIQFSGVQHKQFEKRKQMSFQISNFCVLGGYERNTKEYKYEWQSQYGYFHRVGMLREPGLISDELNNKLLKEIGRLKENCDDYRYMDMENEQTDVVLKLQPDLNNWKVRIQNLLDPLLRSDQWWIPAVFYIDNDYNVCIISDIHNLSRLRYRRLYLIIEQIFSLMIPMFEWILGDIKLNNETIQVIISMQNYELQPDTTYNGQIHREGYKSNEEIEAVGIYYFDKLDDCFIKDEFEFNMVGTGVCAESEYHYHSIYIKKGNCLVFNNKECNHRLKELINGSKTEIAHRSIMNFMLPEFKIMSTNDIKTNNARGGNFSI
eukprot:28784_1